jgi:hypothetical protein
MISTAISTGSPSGADVFTPVFPAGRLKAVRKGNTRSKNLIALLFAIPIYLSGQDSFACPKKLQVSDDTTYMQRLFD